MQCKKVSPVPTLTVRGLTIGNGKPKVVVPITAARADEVLSIAAKIAHSPAADLAEFRLDYLKDPSSPDAVAALCRAVSETLHDKPLLVTFRTEDEGGARSIAPADYEALYTTLIESGAADMIDLQMEVELPRLRRLVDAAHRRHIRVILSHHTFDHTPDADVLLARLQRQQALGADILKIAAMPKDAGDTLRMMEVTWRMHSRYASRPLLTMAMGGDGVVSRLSGELTGSALTYGSIGASSAPGQLEATDLEKVLSVIHAATQG